ncbi:MAG: asparaginase [bacterium]|nr:asparaginase [bacterium]
MIPKVLIASMGGTITMAPDKKGILRPVINGQQLFELIPSLKRFKNMLRIEYYEIENLDSTNLNPSHWTKLAMFLAENRNRYDGFIVTHGTDTMAYSASAMAFSLGKNFDRPIIFTGSQTPLRVLGTDAPFNVENSLIALAQAIKEDIVEIMITFGYSVLRAVRTIKISESEFCAFGSPRFPELAHISASGINFDNNSFRKTGEKFTPKFQFRRGILILELVPGQEPGIIIEAINSGKCCGLIMRSHGSGNVPIIGEYSLIPVIQEAVKKDIPVLISTKFVGGQTKDIYEPARIAIRAGAIPTGDMTDIASQVKFMWALDQGVRKRQLLHDFIHKDFVGEITEEKKKLN